MAYKKARKLHPEIELRNSDLDKEIRTVLENARTGGWAPGTSTPERLFYNCTRSLTGGGDMYLTFGEMMDSLNRLIVGGVVKLGVSVNTPMIKISRVS